VVCKTQHERPVEISSRLQDLQSTSVKKKISIAIGTMGKAYIFAVRIGEKREEENNKTIFSNSKFRKHGKKRGKQNLSFNKTVNTAVFTQV